MLLIRMLIRLRLCLALLTVTLLGMGVESELRAETFTIDFTAWPNGTRVSSIPIPDGFSLSGNVEHSSVVSSYNVPPGNYTYAYGAPWDFKASFNTYKVRVTKVAAEVIAVNPSNNPGFYLGGPSPTLKLWTARSSWEPALELPCVLESNQPFTQCTLSASAPEPQSADQWNYFTFAKGIGGSPYNYSWWLALISKVTIEYELKTRLDLTVEPVIVSQPGAEYGPGGVLNVASGVPVQVSIPVTGTGFNSPERRSTEILLKSGRYSASRIVSLSEIETAGGTLNIPLTLSFDPSEAGIQTITAEINPENILPEINYSNNMTSVQVKVVAPYKLAVRPLDGSVVQAGPPQEVEVSPSRYACGATTADVLRQARLEVKCVDESSGEAKENCSFRARLEEGPDDGGHDRAHSGSRPLGKLLPNSATASTVIPLAGTTVQFESPDVAGSVNFVIEGKSPTGTDLKPVTVRYRVKTSGFEPITASGLTIDVASHSNGVYGTSDMNQKLSIVVQRYLENAQTSGTDDPPGLRSEGATLPWGGLFDYRRSWNPPHCGHRDGKTLDLSMSVFSGYSAETRQTLKTALAQAIRSSGFAFTYAPESPSNPQTDHWHIQLK